MKIIEGNLIELAKAGHFSVLAHGCNCFNTKGAGFAKAVNINFPEAYRADQATKKGDRNKLGTYTVTKHGDLTILNCYTQYNYGRDGKRYVDYGALQRCFEKIKSNFSGERIGFPLIGAGLAVGDWDHIATIIDNALQGEDYALVVLPKRTGQR